MRKWRRERRGGRGGGGGGGGGERGEEQGEGGEGWSVEARGGRGGRVVGARSGVEEVVAGIWGEVLGRKEVGVEENFFELGGHSLLATQVMARVRSVLEVELPLRVMFEGATVGELAAKVEAARAAAGRATDADAEAATESGASTAGGRLGVMEKAEREWEGEGEGAAGVGGGGEGEERRGVLEELG